MLRGTPESFRFANSVRKPVYQCKIYLLLVYGEKMKIVVFNLASRLKNERKTKFYHLKLYARDNIQQVYSSYTSRRVGTHSVYYVHTSSSIEYFLRGQYSIPLELSRSHYKYYMT